MKKQNRKFKGSLNARAVAKEVASHVGKGQKVVLGKIIKKHGYSTSISESPQKVTNTKSFQEEIDPVVSEMIKKRDMAVKAMSGKKMTATGVKNLAHVVDLLTKNIQLLGGKATERLQMVPLLDIDDIRKNNSNNKDNEADEKN